MFTTEKIGTFLFILMNILFWVNPTYSQSIELVRGNKSKSIEVGRSISLKYKKDNNEPKCDYCLHKNITGTLTGITNEYITVEVKELRDIKSEDDFELVTIVSYKENLKELEVPISEIFYIKSSKSEKAEKNNGLGLGIGGISFFTGLYTLVTGIFILDNKSQNRLFAIGLGEIGAGIISIIFSYKRGFNLKSDAVNPWKIVN